VIHLSNLAQDTTFRRTTNQDPAFAANHEELFPFPHLCRILDIPRVASPFLKNNTSDVAKSGVEGQ